MKRVTKVPVWLRDGTVEPVDGWEEGGLLIHKAPHITRHYKFWNVTHIATGFFVDTYIDTQQQAREIVRALLNLGIDWTRPVPVAPEKAGTVMDAINDVRRELQLTAWEWVDDELAIDLSLGAPSVEAGSRDGDNSGSVIDNA